MAILCCCWPAARWALARLRVPACSAEPLTTPPTPRTSAVTEAEGVSVVLPDDARGPRYDSDDFDHAPADMGGRIGMCISFLGTAGSPSSWTARVACRSMTK